MKDNVKLLSAACLALLVMSCSEDQVSESRNLEKIHSEEGVPVRVRQVEEETFVTTLFYNSTVKGIRESSGSAMISDTVESILFEIGDYVEKDQTVIRFPESNPSASYFQAEAAFKAAEQAFRRVENLYKNNGVSRQSYDDARTQYEVQLANWENVQKLVSVKAPISGYITRINVGESDNVKPGTELFTVSNFSELMATVYVNDDQIGEIRAGQKVTASWKEEQISGTVTQVDLAKDPRKKAFAVKVRLDNSLMAVPSGVFVDLTIETSSIQGAFVLHRNEMLYKGEEAYVLLESEGYAKKQVVVPGASQGMYYHIESGLTSGDSLITEGLNMVRADGKVRIMDDAETLVARQ